MSAGEIADLAGGTDIAMDRGRANTEAGALVRYSPSSLDLTVKSGLSGSRAPVYANKVIILKLLKYCSKVFECYLFVLVFCCFAGLKLCDNQKRGRFCLKPRSARGMLCLHKDY